MNLENYYYYFEEAIPKRTCEEIINFANSKKESLATTGDYSKKLNLTEQEIKDIKKLRDSNIIWLNDEWIYNIIRKFVHAANENAGWNFQWDWMESMQFTKYKLNQFYGWHCDSWEKPYDNNSFENFKGKIRKLSVIVALSDSKDYKGGELQFDYRNTKEGNNIVTCDKLKKQGSVIVFPSFVWHQVTPVTKGTRYSLVNWCLGQTFK